MSILKKIFVFTIIFFLPLSCSVKKKIYDIDKPEIEFYKQIEEAFFIQFNEPIEMIKLFLNNEIVIRPNFPKTNFNLSYDLFNNFHQNSFKIIAMDTSKNIIESAIPTPIINMNPAIIFFNEVRIKYSKNKPQHIKLKVKKAGSIKGFKLILFLKNEKIELPFLPENVECLDELNLIIKINEKSEITPLSFKKNKNDITLKNRLSQIYSLIMILNNKDELVDYILYYNLKQHDKEYYEKNKKFSTLKNEIITRSSSCKIFDISTGFFSFNNF